MVDLPTSTWIAAGLVFAAVAFGMVSLVMVIEWVQEQRRKRQALDQLRNIANRGFDSVRGVGLFRTAGSNEAEWVQGLTVRMPHLQDVQLMIEQAGLRWSVQSYVVYVIGFAVAFGLVTLMLTARWPFAVPAALFGGALPYLRIRRRRRKRFRAFEEQLPEAIDLMTRAIRAGHPLSAGLGMVADESGEPLGTEFRRAFEEQRFGLPLEDSLLGMADRVDLVDVRIMVTAILIQRTVGGNLAEILDNLAYTIRERFKIRRQLRVYTAQGRISGYVLAVLPIAVGFIIFLLNPGYTMTLFRDPAGKVALVTAIILQISGFFWIRKIIDIEI